MLSVCLLLVLGALMGQSLTQRPPDTALGPNPGTESACTAKVKTGPINLNFPVVFSGFSVKMNLSSVLNTTMTKVSMNHIVYEANFGNVTYGEQNGQVYHLKRLDVLSPSVHMMHNVSFPFEVQVQGTSASGGSVTLVYLFERFEDAHNPFLMQLGFGKGDINGTKIFNVSKMHTAIRTEVSLFSLVGENTGHLMYEGTSILGNCSQTVYLVSKDIYWMSEAQFKEIGQGFQPLVPTKLKPMIINIYQNFDENIETYPFNLSRGLGREKFPSSFDFARYMYNPNDNETMGRVDPDSVPGWLSVNGSVETPPNMPRLPSRLKYLPFYYRRTGAGKFSPVYIIVQTGYSFTKNLQPANVPILVRNNLPVDGLRPLVGVRMGVTRIDPVLLEKMERELLQKEREEREKLLAEQKKRDEEAALKKKEDEARLKYEEEKRKALEEYQKQVVEAKRKNNTIRWERRCVEWRLIAIVNRYHGNDDAWDIRGMWKGGNDDLYTCVRWQDVRIGENGELVDAKGYPMPKFPDFKPQNLAVAVAAVLPKLNPKKCKTYLEVILNRNWKDLAFADLVHQQCKFANGTITKTPQLAFVNAELLDKGDTALAASQSKSLLEDSDLDEQQSMDPLLFD